jgi:hypothetical protein
MFKRRNKKRSVLLTLLLTLLFAVAVFAYTNTNTFASGAVPGNGDGTHAISGYVIDHVVYTVDDSVNPATITAWKFNLDSQANSVESNLNAADALVHCVNTNVVTYEWTCTPGSPVAMDHATLIRVLAY